MMFPYLELPLIVQDGEIAKRVKLKIQPSNIGVYHETIAETTIIYLNNEAFQIALSIDEYESQIVQYWDLITDKKSIKQKLGIVQ